MQKLRLAFLGTPDIACPFLRRAAASGHEVAGVISQPDRPVGRGLKLSCAPVNALAGELEIKAYKPANRRELHEAVAELKPDLGVVVAYGRLIPEETLALARYGFLNVHFSLLPKYRGAAPVQWALINGEKVTGVTLFWLDKGMDTGPVFLRRSEPVLESDDAASLFARLTDAGADLLAEGLARVAAGDIAREPQAGEPSLAPKLTGADALLDFSRPAAELLGRVRGLACGARARFFLERDGRRTAVQVMSAALPAAPGPDGAPGSVLAVEPGGGFVVKCGVGGLLLRTLKPEGKKEMPAADFLNGLRLKPGDLLR
ncbi:MAG TPA: methionyl-tRNA formyltransferase [Elusimicrobia bacterium]|nr:MAG: methionyl-tRNA formyltransferase [Elusimicrobia bacterium GWB2_63_16]HAN04611.1 methionyl-tRNA formyltransferase [Elusimicrobiota bacterium]HAU90307.1 methionyl-tRNA formyltransferase [Elusimicrobiota bacterium]